MTYHFNYITGGLYLRMSYIVIIKDTTLHCTPVEINIVLQRNVRQNAPLSLNKLSNIVKENHTSPGSAKYVKLRLSYKYQIYTITK